MKPLLDFPVHEISQKLGAPGREPSHAWHFFFSFFFKKGCRRAADWVIMCHCVILKWAWSFETQHVFFFSAQNSYLKSHRSVVIHLIESQTALLVATTPLTSPVSVRNQTWRSALFPSLWLERLLYHWICIMSGGTRSHVISWLPLIINTC